MTQIKPAEIQYYFDADVLGLGKTVARLRADVTYPGDRGGVVHKRERPPCVIADPATDDDIWIPTVAARGWLIITRDSKIQERRAEIAAVRDSGARMVALSSREASEHMGPARDLDVPVAIDRGAADFARSADLRCDPFGAGDCEPGLIGAQSGAHPPKRPYLRGLAPMYFQSTSSPAVG